MKASVPQLGGARGIECGARHHEDGVRELVRGQCLGEIVSLPCWPLCLASGIGPRTLPCPAPRGDLPTPTPTLFLSS
jgi:hypothetical protein